MKKEDIIIIRITSAAILLAALALILLFGAQSGLFYRYIEMMNNNEYSNMAGSAYNVAFFNGVNTIYTFLFDLTLYTTIIGAMGLLLKLKGVSSIAVCGAVSSVVTGFYIVFVYILENNVLLHKAASYIYLHEAGNYLDGERILHAKVIIVGVVLIIIGILAIMIIKSSNVKKIYSYSSSYKHTGLIAMLPVFYGCIFMEIVKKLLLEYVIGIKEQSGQVYSILTQHYFEGIPLFHIKLIWVVLISAIAIVLVNRFVRRFQIDKTIIGIFFALAYIVQIVFILVNPPRLFGYLSFDEHICDMVDSSNAAYMIMYALDVVFVSILTAVCLKDNYSHKKILITIAIHFVISILAVMGLGFIGISAIFAGCAAANLVALISFFYTANIRASHH